MARKARSPDGSILILALWVLFFLAALALAVGAHVSAGLRLAGSMKQDARAYHLARAGVAYAARTVACNTNRWDGRGPTAWNSDPDVFIDQAVGEGGRFSIITLYNGPDGVTTNTGLEGVESRLNLNRANQRIFLALFTRVGGVSSGQAAAIYEAVKAYRKAKQQRLLTIRTARGYPEPDSGGEASLDSVYELQLVDGMNAGVFARVEPYVTVFGNGLINANTASPELMLCGAEAYPKAADRIGEILAAREGGAVLHSPAELSSITFLTVRSTAFQGIAVGRATTGAEAAWIEFVVDNRGYRRYWHEF